MYHVFKKKMLAFFLCLFFLLCYTMYNWLQNYKSIEIPENRIICKFPKIDPYDSSIITYVTHTKNLQCPKVLPYLTFIDFNGFLQINKTETKKLKIEGLFKCFYRTFEKGLYQRSINYDNSMEYLSPIAIPKELVEINCYWTNGTENEKPIYSNIHVHPAEKADKIFAKHTGDKLSVLIIALDSVSYSMLQRNLPKTYEYLTNVMGMIMMKQFNKVGENTYPNMVAALTGRRLQDEQENMLAEFGRGQLNKLVDNLPFIWNKFAEKGYATSYNEDRPDITFFDGGIFNGFVRKLFDYYYTPYWQYIQDEFDRINSKNGSEHKTYCFRNKLITDLYFDIIKRHVISTEKFLQFMFNLFVYVTHEENADIVEIADNDFRLLFQNLFTENYFNKTAILFTSDHGARFTAIRKTYVGFLEETNSFLGVWFPEWFHGKYPFVRKNLHINSERLNTPFDMHETLLDILNGEFPNVKNYEHSQRGRSLLYELPLYRTCTEAGIPDRYCLCTENVQLNLSVYLPHLTLARKTLVSKLNDIIKNNKPKCRDIEFIKIERAELVDQSENNTVDFNAEMLRVRITILTQPNDAVFEGRLIGLLKGSIREWTVEGKIERLSKFGNSANCVDGDLKKYCTCAYWQK